MNQSGGYGVSYQVNTIAQTKGEIMKKPAALLMAAIFAASALALSGCPGGSGGGYGLGPSQNSVAVASSAFESFHELM